MNNQQKFTSQVEVSLYKPILIEANMCRLMRENNPAIVNKPLTPGVCAIVSASAEHVIKGNLYTGSQCQFLCIPYKTRFFFSWVKSEKKNRLEWAFSLS